MEAKKIQALSFEEYIAIEQSTGTRHEYHDGQIYAMAGGSLVHGYISSNLLIEFGIALRKGDRNCRPVNSEVKLQIASLNKYLYPDMMVVCDSEAAQQTGPQAVQQPILIIEVLSKSTEAYDRGDKFFFYKQLPSLQYYLLIDQSQAVIDLYTRVEELWKINRIAGIDQTLSIPELNIALPLSAIYRDVALL